MSIISFWCHAMTPSWGLVWFKGSNNLSTHPGLSIFNSGNVYSTSAQRMTTWRHSHIMSHLHAYITVPSAFIRHWQYHRSHLCALAQLEKRLTIWMTAINHGVTSFLEHFWLSAVCIRGKFTVRKEEDMFRHSEQVLRRKALMSRHIQNILLLLRFC